MPVAPRVSILILNYNGRAHLQACLPTVAAQVYPKDRFTIEVIDNGSSDGSVELVREQFPDVAVHALGRNFGFAPAYDQIARTSDADYLVFLNNDTRVEPTWLAELTDAAARQGADCVASRILDWDGSRIDFVGGLTTFIGHSWQRFYGEAVAGHDEPEVPLLFACGGSMLISRAAYIDSGGFDTDFFAYFEDVDLGWRLSILGYRTVLAPRATTYHRLHGTAGRFAFAQRLRLYERNALAMIYKNYEEESLRRVLPAAVALSLLRGLAHSGLDPAAFAFGAPLPDRLDVPARTVVHLLALEDFVRQLPELARKRDAIQSRRRVSDRELAPLFGSDPFRAHEAGRYEAVLQALVRDFGIDELFGRRSASVAIPQPLAGIGEQAAAPVAVSAEEPLVSIVILTLLGPKYLPDCLSSLRALTYPAARREVIVVDNASNEDPRGAVEEFYPGARLVRNDRNIGFGAGNNAGARAARGEYVVFLNDDTRVHPDWLTELVKTARRRGAASVASRILNWDGTRLDFVEGAVNCEGKGFQLEYGRAAETRGPDEKPLLFANGAGMLVRRDLFLESGGWDEATFAYYEDVELGWRLWVLGHEVWASPRSIVYHRHNGTSGAWPPPPRVRLFERNSLRILYTLLEQDTLARVLPAAMMLAGDRALLTTAVSRASAGDAAARGGLAEIAASAKGALRAAGVSRHRSLFDNARRLGLGGLFGAARQVARETVASPASTARDDYRIEAGAAGAALDGRAEAFPPGAAAALTGLREFLESIPELSARRTAFQSARRRSDAEILSRFGSHWLEPTGAAHQQAHDALHALLVEHLGIAAAAAEQTAAR